MFYLITQVEADVLSVLKARNKYSTASDVSDLTGKSRSRTSAIMRSLANRGILIGRKKGTTALYTVDEKAYLALKNNKRTTALLKNIPGLNDSIINLFFGFKEDAITAYNKEKAKKAINQASENKKEAILSFIESLIYPSFEEVWEIAPGIHTNYDFDLNTLKCEPEIINAVVDIAIGKFKSKLTEIDGIIAIRHNKIDVKSPACGIYTRNTIPYAVALSLKIGKPLIIADYENIYGNIEEYGNYVVIDDGPLYGDDLIASIRHLKKKANISVFFILERNNITTKKLDAAKIPYFVLFRTKDIIDRLFKSSSNLFFNLR